MGAGRSALHPHRRRVRLPPCRLWPVSCALLRQAADGQAGSDRRALPTLSASGGVSLDSSEAAVNWQEFLFAGGREKLPVCGINRKG